jgi:hypothetical protein
VSQSEKFRPDFLFIEPWLDVVLLRRMRDRADGWLVFAIVEQEDIKDFRFGT